MTVFVDVEAARQPEVLELLRGSDEFTLSLYPPDSCYLLGIDELEAPNISVFVAREGGSAVGMAALVDRGDRSAELKRMFVPEAARGRGIAGRILAAVEATALATAIELIQLETGPLQHAAIALYERCGFVRIPNFGLYVGDPNSICYEKVLS